MELKEWTYSTNLRPVELDVLRISEYERQHIGQDLHDGLGSQLTGMNMICLNLARLLEKEGHALAQELFELAEQIKEADYQTRNIARGLAGLPQEQGALIRALYRLTDTTQRGFGVACSLSIVGEISLLDHTVSSHLYRIAQEAVTNALRHGKATRIEIHLKTQQKDVSLEIVDNGCGIPTHFAESGGMGLRNMRYRANLMGAVLSIEKGMEGGTVVQCQLLPGDARSQLGQYVSP